MEHSRNHIDLHYWKNLYILKCLILNILPDWLLIVSTYAIILNHVILSIFVLIRIQSDNVNSVDQSELELFDKSESWHLNLY